MIQSQMIEKEEELVCSMNHQYPIQMVIFDKNLEKNKKLLCQYCIDNLDIQLNNSMSFKKVSVLIEQNQKKKLEQVEYAIKMNIQQIDEIKQTLIQLKSYINQQLDQLIQNTEEWMNSLLQIAKQNGNYSFYEQLDNIINQVQQEDFIDDSLNAQIQILNYSYNKKIIDKIDKFKQFKQTKKCEQLLINLENINNNNYYDQMNLLKEQQDIDIIRQNEFDVEFKLIDDLSKQDYDCYSIVFNKIGSIMISTDRQDILIWNFTQGKLQQCNRFRQHQLSHHIQCLVYSKKMNFFISGSWDNSIICWKQINKNEWQWSQQYKQHNSWIFCLILNKQEDQLISSDRDNSIKIWNVDLIKNKLTYLYSLDNTTTVYSLCLNQSETMLAQCAKHYYLIWEKGIDEKWQLKCKQQVVEGNQIYFINDQQFIWITRDKYQDQILIFELQNGIFKQNQDKTIQLNQNDQCQNDFVNFPIIYNKDKNILLIRHKYHIYIINIINNGEFKIIGSLNCQIDGIYGTMTDDAKYLVYLDRKQKKYLSYELLYK